MEDFVSRTEFENLKKEVADIKTELNKSTEILSKIDKKTDIISERLESSDKLSDLQNENIETRITSKLEPIKKDIASNKKDIDEINDNRKWLWRAMGSVLIGIVIKLIFDVSAYVTSLQK